uniref:Uncharacterized protein n=1 Tax=Arundo donax TaxID=35708 RepID=A0A0A9BLZ1_ARUDO
MILSSSTQRNAPSCSSSSSLASVRELLLALLTFLLCDVLCFYNVIKHKSIGLISLFMLKFSLLNLLHLAS